MESGPNIELKHFDIEHDVSDHHFCNDNQSNNSKAQKLSNANSSLHKKIMKEWKSLEKDLPESIYVRVYETRLDLLRAVIIGAEGTPYHNGLFFFDICLPSDYPKQPPKVYHHSHGLRLNPNLYADGKVCLSLINTWSGTWKEKWTQNSTILQLLVSIQGLVLVERPYFNEPAFSGFKNSESSRWIKKSAGYNAEVFLLSCKTMVYKMRNPPRCFEILVKQHFRQRAESILSTIRNYHALYKSPSSKVLSSFNLKLVSMYSELARAMGINSVLTLEELSPPLNGEKPKKGLINKLSNLVMCFWT